MTYRTIADLPSNVQSVLSDENDVAINRAIRSAFFLEQDQFDMMLDVVIEVILGTTPVLDMPTQLTKIPRSEQLDIRSLALRIALDKLWPLQEFLKNVDVLITRLGGRVPEPVSLQSPLGPDESVRETKTEWLHGSAKEMLFRHRSFNDLYVTRKPLQDDGGRLRAPSITNWLQDYLHTVGASGGGSLKRSQYLARSANALVLNDAEKQNLLNFLVSYEEDQEMYWHVAEEQYIVVEANMPAEEKATATAKQSSKQLSELAALYAQLHQKYQALFAEKKKGLDLEINGNIKKMTDILWDALALGDTDRCLAALDYLIDHHWFLEMLKTDHRFKGILTRFIGVKYGAEARNAWNGDATSVVMLGLLWKLLLVEKLGLDEQTASILADYYRKRLGQTVSPMYLDLKSGGFVFREVAYNDRTFAFA